MDRGLVIKLKKPTQAETLIWIILVVPFLFGGLIELLGVPTVVKYVCDVAWLGLLLLIFLQRWRKTEEQKAIVGFVIGFLFYTLVGYIVNFQSPLYYLWGVRNNFRVYVFFFGIMVFGKGYLCGRMLGFFDSVFWVNAAVCVVQYFVLGKEQDYLGGVFGVSVGCNSWLNNYFVIVSVISILEYLNGKGSLWNCVAKNGTMLIISAFAELKFFYVEFVVILVMAIVLTDFSWKKILVVVGGIAGVVLTTKLLEALFPEFEGVFTLETMYEIATSDSGYTSSGDINRLNAITVLSERFLKNWPEQLIGMGLGNSDTSGFAFLTTPFYTKYEDLNYLWFSSATAFLETGYIGLIFFFGFFVLVFLKARKLAVKQPAVKPYCQMAMICAVCCILIGIYNSSLRTEAGYMMYFMLALPFIRKGTYRTNSARISDVPQSNQ